MGTGTSVNYRFVLYTHIREKFSITELSELCFELGIEYDDLEGTTLSNKAMSLITYSVRHDLLRNLIDLCNRERPQLAPIWEKLKKIVEQNPALFSPNTTRSEQIQSIGMGLTALAQLAHQQKSFISFAASFQKDAASTQQRVDRVRYFKSIHDNFQLMEDCFSLVLNERRSLTEGRSDWLLVETNSSVLAEAIEDVLGSANQTALIEPTESWMRSLMQGQEFLKTAVTSTNLEHLDKAIRSLQRALNQGPTLINDRLVQAVRDLPFTEMVNGLKAVFNFLRQLPQLNIPLLKQLAQGIKNLADLAIELQTLVRDHNLWQEFDDLLRRAKMGLVASLGELELTWPDLRGMGVTLYGHSRASNVLLLQRLENKLDIALQTANRQSILVCFDAYRSCASRHFREVDKRLLDYCLQLQQIVAPINTLLSVLR